MERGTGYVVLAIGQLESQPEVDLMESDEYFTVTHTALPTPFEND